MRCTSCEKLRSLKKVGHSTNGSSWYCNGKEVTADTPACEDFVLRNIVVCPEKNKFRQLTVAVCIHYQQTGKCNCRIGSELSQYMRQKPAKILKRRK